MIARNKTGRRQPCAQNSQTQAILGRIQHGNPGPYRAIPHDWAFWSYFMPHDCHRALAVTGAVATATACVTPGTIAASMVGPIALPGDITIEHPSGRIAVRLEPDQKQTVPVA